MRIMTILGSPRRHGNTAKVLAWVESAWKAVGHTVDSACILDYNVQGCTECLTCRNTKIELCVLSDDANGLFRRMAAADLVLFAAPIFCWGFPAQVKGLIDRLICMMDFEERRTGVPRLYDKPMAVLLTAGGGMEDNGDLVIRGYEEMLKLLQSRMAGHLLISECTTPDALGDDAKAQAVAFAKMLEGQVDQAGSASR